MEQDHTTEADAAPPTSQAWQHVADSAVTRSNRCLSSMFRSRSSPSSSADGLGSLSTGQLRQLLHDEPKVQRIIQLSKKVQSLQSEQERYSMANYIMAKKNLSLRPWLENGKANLASKYQQLQEVKMACQEKQRKLEIHLQKWNLQAAVIHIQAELDRAEAESEAQVERFLEGTVSLNSFLETFQSGRKVVHLRKCQLEKLQEVLLRNQRIQHSLQARLNIAASQSSRVCRVPVSQHSAAPRTYRLTPAFLISSDKAAPFPLPSAPPYRILPPLGTQVDQCRVSQPRAQSLNLPHGLVAYIPLVSPKPYKSNYADKLYQPPHR